MPLRFQRQSPAVFRRGRKRHIVTNERNIYRSGRGWYLHKSFRQYRYAEFFSDVEYSGDGDSALEAARERRAWLDRHRKRILDRVGVEAARRVFGKHGHRVSSRAVVLRTKVDVRAIVVEVERELEEIAARAIEQLRSNATATTTSTASPSATSG